MDLCDSRVLKFGLALCAGWAMHTYPEPQEIGIRIPRHLIRERFRSGFWHALRGGQLTKVDHLRLSFREGFRAGKLYLRELRGAQGILSFPFRAKVKTKAVGLEVRY